MAFVPSVAFCDVTHARGKAVELRSRHIAAALGVPEFVYGAPLIKKSQAVREVGDGILLCGGGGAILQVKARSRHEGRRDSDEKAMRWVVKHTEAAVRQGRGSKRTISQHQRLGTPVRIIPVRSMVLAGNERVPFEVTLEEDCRSWPIIVIIDHPRDPHFVLPTYEDAFPITLQDWQELNRRLRSVHEVLRYVKRILDFGSEDATLLGHESDRYASLVDFETKSIRHSRTKPWNSYAAIESPAAIQAYRTLIDRTWGDNDEVVDRPIEDYRAILDYLDDAPAIAQVEVGKFLLGKRAELRRVRRRVSGTVLLVDRPLIILIDLHVNKLDKKLWFSELWGLTAVRAIEWEEQMRTYPGALGIGIRQFDELFDEYSFVLFTPPIGRRVPSEIRRSVEWTFGVANFSTFQTRPLKIGRNAKCPCGSDKKYRKCHESVGPHEE